MNKTPASKHAQVTLAFFVVFLGWATNAQAITSPSSLVMQILEMRISRNSNCSDAVVVFKPASPAAVNLVGSPDLGSGVISTGTYHCVMFHISDIVTFSPQASSEDPTCIAGTTYTDDLLKTGTSSETPEGAPITGSSTLEDDPWIYLSDAPSPTVVASKTCFLRANAGAGGPCALAPLAIFSDQTRTLVLNADGQLGEFWPPGSCHLSGTDPVVISIR